NNAQNQVLGRIACIELKKNFSYGVPFPLISYICNSKFQPHNARMVKLVDTLVSGASAERLAGSSPVPGTILKTVSLGTVFLCVVYSLTELFVENLSEKSFFNWSVL